MLRLFRGTHPLWVKIVAGVTLAVGWVAGAVATGVLFAAVEYFGRMLPW
jgi:hypothetical protein